MFPQPVASLGSMPNRCAAILIPELQHEPLKTGLSFYLRRRLFRHMNRATRAEYPLFTSFTRPNRNVQDKLPPSTLIPLLLSPLPLSRKFRD
jgi:hypothetical protein